MRHEFRTAKLDPTATATVGIGLVVPVLPAFLVGAISPQLRTDLGLTETQLGLIVAASFATSAVAAPFAGRLADSKGARTAIVAGTVLSSFTLAGLGIFGKALWPLLALMICAGVSVALVDPGLNRTVSAGIVPERAGLVFGIKEASIPLSTLAAGLAIPTLVTTFGWRSAFGVGVLPLAAISWLLFRNRLVEPAQSLRGDKAAVGSPPRGGIGFLTLGAALGTVAGAGVTVFLTESAAAAGFTPAQGGLLLGAASLVGVASRIVSGAVADRGVAPSQLMAGMLAVGGAAMALGSLHTAGWVVVASVGALAMAWGWTALFFLTLVRTAPDRPGAVAGIGLSGIAVGNTVGPIAFGFMAQAVSFPAAWLLASACAAIGAVVTLRGARTLKAV